LARPGKNSHAASASKARIANTDVNRGQNCLNCGKSEGGSRSRFAN